MSKFLFVTDLDNTLVGDDLALKILNQKLSKHRQEYGTKIVYATGRSPTLYRLITAQKQLLQPDAIIASVGTEIYYHIDDHPDQGWGEILSQGWNREAIASISNNFSDLRLQPPTEQGSFKVSYFLSGEKATLILPQLEQQLRDRGLDVKLIYSSGRDLDILPRHGDKGLAVQYLRHRWEIDATNTVVCGDSGNDISMFSVGTERAIIVANAQPEVLRWYNDNLAEHRYLAKSSYASGIMEGLKYFGFLLFPHL